MVVAVCSQLRDGTRRVSVDGVFIAEDDAARLDASFDEWQEHFFLSVEAAPSDEDA